MTLRAVGQFPVDGLEPDAIKAFTEGAPIATALALSQAISAKRLADVAEKHQLDGDELIERFVRRANFTAGPPA